MSSLQPEEWSWPPKYDESYRPSDDQAQWFPVRETMPSDMRDDLIVERIRAVMTYAWKTSSFYRNKWDDAGIHPSSITTLADFEKVPVVLKEEIRADQAVNEPFGTYLCVPDHEVKHVNGTSGTTGRPTAFGISELDWRSVANAHARVMWGMGIRPSDTVLVASPLSLYWGSWGAYIGAERLGARVFPFGAGTTGQTARTVQWIRQMGVTVFYGTPSYALRLAEVAIEEGVDPRDLGLRIMFFSGEPGASIPAIRSRIMDAFGAKVYDSGSMAEVSPWMHLGASSDDVGGMLCWQDLVYTEVCSPQTHARVGYGSEGTPIYTTLERTSQPMIRLLSNDLTTWEAPSSDRGGRTYPYLPRGIYGRIDDMFTIRGENIHPSAIDDVIMADPGYGGEHRIVISRDQAMDILAVQVEHAVDEAALGAWVNRITDRLRIVLGVGAKVIPVTQFTFDRTEFKARRVIDDRNLLRQISAEGPATPKDFS